MFITRMQYDIYRVYINDPNKNIDKFSMQNLISKEILLTRFLLNNKAFFPLSFSLSKEVGTLSFIYFISSKKYIL